MADKKKEHVTVVQKGLPIEWVFPDDLETKYANQMYVASSDADVMICFFETRPLAPLAGDEKEIAKKIEKMKSLPAHCVARIAMTKERYASFLRALNLHFEKTVKVEIAEHELQVEGRKEAENDGPR